ncbi:MAG: helix-turn-helix transcriptional regulator [Streptococcaceae bacterium]|nr:helix-turn-helix transcriptional regulator [Streptococcaceae bacterium]
MKIQELRERLTDIKGGRRGFINYSSLHFFGGEDWISVKTLTNYELGKNTPSLEYAKKLSVALQMNFTEFISEIDDYI